MQYQTVCVQLTTYSHYMLIKICMGTTNLFFLLERKFTKTRNLLITTAGNHTISLETPGDTKLDLLHETIIIPELRPELRMINFYLQLNVTDSYTILLYTKLRDENRGTTAVLSYIYFEIIELVHSIKTVKYC